ncbi:endonuclease/exonuclease/phosphatase family metal-dependent hydrolase [Duganella sp. SG902]|uniref:endonuclease/exonuclease/phosphatase family protein n=1 Tax=Duganella sp. SG902 TaxID=2587016 RepID=UPI00159D1392|nr:endonuclease/exonuclease/phosphatase family protein [Duganella sp. SG902]NVM77553.1 endonuclease/exonuclease/phosphatase family metal-dependent hydrolase [Duganella sp. SG902]
MTIRIASFNMENLFTRPLALSDEAEAAGRQAVEDHAELNAIVEKDSYSGHDKRRLLELDEVYRFSSLNAPSNTYVVLNRVRGQLYSRSKTGAVTIVAAGRADWTGWFDLRMGEVTWAATYNTARVIAGVNPDILVCVEVESRPTLGRFNSQVLKAQFNHGYPHHMVIDGNDERGIDVGILSRYPISGMASHVDDARPDGSRIFSRDCPEYWIALPDGGELLVLPNHFKSKRGGDTPAMQEKRRAQAERAHAIAVAGLERTPHVLIAGDLNDTPAQPLFNSLWQDGFTDIQDHPSYPTDRPGTYGTGTAANKIDYLIMSPALRQRLTNTGIERQGSYHPKLWQPYDTVTKASDEASDHHLVWAEFDA